MKRQLRAYTVSTPRLAATVMLARPAPRGFELYMARRSRHSAFAADAYVFPGGAVEPQDFAEQTRARTLGLDDERIAVEFRAAIPSELPSGEPPVDRASAGALITAALRELFEEAGILLARTRGGDAVNAKTIRSSEVQGARASIARGELSFERFLNARDWYADGGALALFSHWITPPSESRRFNAHFFVARAPTGQTGFADAAEMHEGVWIAPADALARGREGRFHLVYPTIKHLQRLATFGTLDDLETFARTKPILTMLPNATDARGFAIPPALEDAW